MKKRILSVLLALALLCSMLPPISADAVASGTCGTNLSWTLKDGTLTITGTGAMTDYEKNNAPWNAEKASITQVIITPGVTSIGAYAFYLCENLQRIFLPNGIKTVGSYALAFCYQLQEIELPDTVTTIGSSAFKQCYRLLQVAIPGKVSKISKDTFYNCKSLYRVAIPESVKTIESYAFDGCEALVDVRYSGTQTQWDAIAIATYNEELTKATLYCESTGNLEDNAEYKKTLIDPSFYPESSHPYEENLSEREMFIWPGADCLFVTFSEETFVENNCDYIYLYLDDGKLVEKYTGAEAAGVTVKIPGDTFQVQLSSNQSGQDYGYSFSAIEAGTAVISRGVCGDALTWMLTADGTMTISGTGAMKNYTQVSAPWYYLGDRITRLVIDEGVTTIGSHAFRNCENLTEVVFGSSVTEIGYESFYSCDGLTTLMIPDSVTGISEYAFSYCSALQVLTIGDGLTTIENHAFANCTALETVSVGKGVTTIEEYAFRECTALKSVSLPISLESIGYEAFYACAALTDVYYAGTVQQWEGVQIALTNDSLQNVTLHTGIPSGYCGENVYWKFEEGTLTVSGTGDMYDVTTNGRPWEGYVSDITAVIIESGVTAIGNWAFYNCTNLKTVSIADGVTKIGYCAFYNCTGLEMITIPGTVESIGNCAFAYSQNLRTVTLQNGVLTIGDEAFRSCNSLRTVYMGNSVTAIGNYAFAECSALGSVYISKGVTQIGFCAFSGCGYLSSVQIPAGVTYIGGRAFEHCGNLRVITIAGTVTRIGYEAFSNCNALQEVYYDGTPIQWQQIDVETGNTLLLEANIHFAEGSGYCGDNVVWVVMGDTLTITGTGAMWDFEDQNQPWYGFYESITTVSLGEGVTRIGNNAFRRMPALSGVSLPDSLKQIGGYAFAWCDKLTAVDLPAGLIDIEQWAFRECHSLKTPTFPEGLQRIGASAFGYCDRLQGVQIPASVVYIGDHAFYGCFRLTGIWVDENNLYYASDASGALLNKEKTELLQVPGSLRGTYTVPDGVTVIRELAVSDCNRLESLILPQGVTSIEKNGVYFCAGLKSVTVPNSLVDVAVDAFGGCTELDDVYYIGTEEQWQKISIAAGNEYFIGANIHYMPENPARVVVSDAFAIVGKTVDVTLTLENNPGIASMMLKVHYDSSVLTLVDVIDGGILGENAHKPQRNQPYTLCWVNDLATENFTQDGVLVTLRFLVAEDAPEGNYEIYATYDASKGDIMDKDLADVSVEMVAGTVEVAQVLLGDVNGDGSVNTLDRVILTRYLGDWDGYTIDHRAADVNQDGVVDARDRAILTRHLADWEGYESLPYKI